MALPNILPSEAPRVGIVRTKLDWVVAGADLKALKFENARAVFVGSDLTITIGSAEAS